MPLGPQHSAGDVASIELADGKDVEEGEEGGHPSREGEGVENVGETGGAGEEVGAEPVKEEGEEEELAFPAEAGQEVVLRFGEG